MVLGGSVDRSFGHLARATLHAASGGGATNAVGALAKLEDLTVKESPRSSVSRAAIFGSVRACMIAAEIVISHDLILALPHRRRFSRLVNHIRSADESSETVRELKRVLGREMAIYAAAALVLFLLSLWAP